MKRIAYLCCLLLCFLFPLSALGESTLDDALSRALDELDLSALSAAFGSLTDGEDGLRALLAALVSGKQVWDGAALVQALLNRFLQAASATVRRLPLLMAPALLCGVMTRVRASLFRAQTGALVETACFAALAAVLARDLGAYLTLTAQSVTAMSSAMQTLFPLLVTLLSAVGGTAGAAVYQPAAAAAAGSMTTWVRTFTLRLALSYGTVVILSHLSEQTRLKKLAALLRQATAWTLGAGFTLFLAVTALQGTTAAARDGIGIRAAKYAADNFVPVVGGMFADTMDTLAGSSLIVKNALGVTGLAALLLLSAGPLLQTAAGCMLYKLAAGLLEPLAPDRLSDCLSDFSSVLSLLSAVQLSVGAMFFLLVAQMLAAGNMIVMLR